MEDTGAPLSAPPEPASAPAPPASDTPAQGRDETIDHSHFGIVDDGEGLDLTKTSAERREALERKHLERAEQHPEFKGEKTAKPAAPKSPTATPPAAGAPAAKQQEQEADDPEKPFKFGGGQFKDQAAAEHSMRTLRGTFKSTVNKLNEAAQSRDQAITVANSWKSQAEALQAELEQYRAGKKQAPAAAAPQGEAAGARPSAVGGIDVSVLPAIMADPELGPTGALIYVVDQLAKNAEANNAKLLEQFNGTLKERFAPLDQQSAQSRAVAQADELVTSMSTWIWPAGHAQAGQPAYPELQSDEVQEAIGRLHIESGRDPALLLTQKGLEDAIYRYRAIVGAPAAAPAPVPQPQPTPARQPSSADTAAALSNPAAPAIRPTNMDAMTPAQRIKEGMRRAPSFHEHFGVAP